MHVIGEEKFVKLDHPYTYYQQAGLRESAVNKEIYDKLTLQGVTWSEFDNWEYHTNGNITNNYDGVIDMIYKVHRHKYSGIFSYGNASGYALLGVADNQMHYPVDPANNKYIYGGFPNIPSSEIKGSGLTVTGNTTAEILTKEGVLGRLWHEHGHYTFGAGHGQVGLMGDAWDPFMTPSERKHINYITDHYSYTNVAYEEIILSDYSARTTNSTHLLRVQLPNSQLLIANRNKVSIWDRPMIGDTAHGRFFNYETNYGGGVYIYHISDLGLPSWTYQDVECADGLWHWEQNGFATPDWQINNPWLPVLNRTDPIRGVNDNGIGRNVNEYPNTVKDGLTIRGYTIPLPPYQQPSISPKWFSIGEKELQQYGDGKDRIYTNDEEPWTSREFQVDRWDAWNVGYNEIISPYSNPSTITWNGQPSGTFIWIKDYNSSLNQYTIRIYRDIIYNPLGGMPESEILLETPPSRPMGLLIDEYYPGSITCHPELKWEHNQEPDMNRSGNPQEMIKRYAIYRSEASNMNSVPPDAIAYPENVYTLIDEVDIEDNSQDKASYIDYSVNLYDCSNLDGPPYGTPYPVRYRVQAIDKDDMTSVLSDFASDVGLHDNGGVPIGSGENPIFSNNEIPDVFNLHQNFPNPFNPVTNIQFDLPNDINVTIKVYDVTGKEVAVLVNEFKNAGSYIVSFNGSKLSSGVYFYKIESGSFTDIKRMLMIK